MFLYTHCVLTPAGTTEGFASFKERKKNKALRAHATIQLQSFLKSSKTVGSTIS